MAQALALLGALAALPAGLRPFDAAALAQPGDGRVHFVVDSLLDLPDAVPGDGTCAAAPPASGCTLRAALDEAESGRRSATVELPAGTITLTRVADPFAIWPSALVVRGANATDVRIVGRGADATTILVAPSGQPERWVHAIVESGARLSLEHVTLLGSPGAGGLRTEGVLAMQDSVVRGCRQCDGLVTVEVGARADLTRTVVVDNVASGILSNSGAVHVVSSTFQGNQVSGPLLWSDGEVTELRDSAVVGNEVSVAGTPIQAAGPLVMSGVTIAENRVQRARPFDPVTLIAASDSLALGHVTMARNRVVAGVLTLIDAGRATGVVRLEGVLIADNGFGGARGATPTACRLPLSSVGTGNVVPDASCVGGASDTRVIAAVRLGSLVDAGGPTPVLVPEAGSPAVGARSTGCPATDQRGAPRPSGQPCAAGAVEPGSARPSAPLLWPLPRLAIGGTEGAPEAPVPTIGIDGPIARAALADDGLVAVRGARVEVWTPEAGSGLVPAASVDLDAPLVDVARIGQTAWTLGVDGSLTPIDVSDLAQPLRGTPARQIVEDSANGGTYRRLVAPATDALWRVATRMFDDAAIDAWRLEGPASARHVATYPGGYDSIDVALGSGRAALIGSHDAKFGEWSHALFLVDAHDATSPTLRSRLLLDGRPVRVALGDERAWVVVRERAAGAPDGVLAVDVADLAAPRALGWWAEPWDEIVTVDEGALLRRGDVVALADLSDALAPRILATARWAPAPTAIERAGDGIVARFADGGLAVVDPTAPGGPALGARIPGGARVHAVHGVGELAVWRDEHDTWRVVAPDAPDQALRALAPTASAAAVAGDRVWLAAADGVYPVRASNGAADGEPIVTQDVRGLAASDPWLWLLGRSAIEAWRIAPDGQATLEASWTASAARTDDLRLATGAAVDDRLLVVDDDAITLLVPDADADGTIAATTLVPAAETSEPGPLAWDGRHLALADGFSLRVFALADDGVAGRAPHARETARFLLEARPEALLVARGRAFVVGGGALDVFDLTDTTPRWIGHVDAPPRADGLAVAGDRLLVAASDGGLGAFRLPTPDRTHRAWLPWAGR